MSESETEQQGKISKLLTTKRHMTETEDWIFSLTPITVAFVFYVLFIINSGIDRKAYFIVMGAAAGLIGLETYWVVRGWRNNNLSTIVMGLLGIFIVLGIVYLLIPYL